MFKKLFDNDAKKRTKKESRTVLLCSYNVDLKESQNNKQVYIDSLEIERKTNPEMINSLKDCDIVFFQSHMSLYLNSTNNMNNATEDANTGNKSNNDDQESIHQWNLFERCDLCWIYLGYN